MLSIKECGKILEAKGKKYSESEVKDIRELLYKLAEIEHNNFKENLKNGKISYNIYQSLN